MTGSKKVPGKSRSSKTRLNIKEHDPERYALLLEKDRIRHQKKMAKKREFWGTKTRATALLDKEEFETKSR